MNTKKIAVVIPFLNEKENVVKTVENILETCSENTPDIILIDDHSNNSNNLSIPNVKIIRNEQQIGTSTSREKGIILSQNPYILTIDAHVKFTNKGWDQKIIERIESNKTAIFCFACQDAEKKDLYYAGGFHFFPTKKPDLMLTPFLIRQEPPKEISDIPVVIGGAYAFYLPWYKHLNGMLGMKGWGVGETFLSLKSWLTGGSCKIDKSIKIEHLFKKQNYLIDESFLHYNRMRLCKTILPYNMGLYPMVFLKESESKTKAIENILKDNKEILQDRISYEKTLTVDIHEIIKKFKLETII